MEVTLKKSSSGTWEVPEFIKQRFKPWQCLWLFTGIIYLLMLAGSYHMFMPDQDSNERGVRGIQG